MQQISYYQFTDHVDTTLKTSLYVFQSKAFLNKQCLCPSTNAIGCQQTKTTMNWGAGGEGEGDGGGLGRWRIGMFTMIGQVLSLDGLTITIAEFYEIVRGHIGKAKWRFVFFYRKHCAQNGLYFLLGPQVYALPGQYSV